MKTTKKDLSTIMSLAWQFVKMNGFSLSEALKCAWANFKVHTAMMQRIVKFYFQKVDGSIREAYGTLRSSLVPVTGESNRKSNATVQTYYDTEKQAWRCFKKANLVRVSF